MSAPKHSRYLGTLGRRFARVRRDPAPHFKVRGVMVRGLSPVEVVKFYAQVSAIRARCLEGAS